MSCDKKGTCGDKAADCHTKGDCHDKAADCHDKAAHGHDVGDFTRKLYYFNSRGRAEAIRWILHYAQLPFEDVRFSFEEWATKKAEGFSLSGQLPMMEAHDVKNDKTIKRVQSFVIARACACFYGLGGKDAVQTSEADEVVEMLREVIEAGVEIMFKEKDEARKAELLNKLKTQTGPTVFGYLEQKLVANGGKFYVGDGVTFADIMVACHIDSVKLMKAKEGKQAEFEEFAKKYPHVAANANAIAESPHIKEWINKRPDTPF